VKRDHLTLALAAALAVASSTGCITETESSTRQAHGMRTEGAILTGDIDAIWARTRQVISSMTGAPLESRGIDRSLRTTVNGVEVTAFVEPYDATRTILHVTADDDELADRIRIRVMTGY
jgi:hypothetical protein